MRGHRVEDFGDCVAMWSDPDVTRYVGGRPLSGEEVWARLLRFAGHWDLMGFGYWVVEEKTTGAFVGEIGFADYKRDIEPPLNGVPEIGWVLASGAHGMGYATEAAGAAIAWGDARFGAAATVCLVHPENVRSIRVAEKCGYRELRRGSYKSVDTIVFGRG